MHRAPAPSLTAWRRVHACEQVCRVDAETLLLDVARAQAPDIIKTLKRYKLRAKVVIEDRSQELSIYATLGPSAHKLWVSLSEGGAEGASARGAAVAVFQDPRLIDLGVRVIAPTQEAFLDLCNTMLAGALPEPQTNEAAAAACAHVSEAAFDMYRLSCGVAQVAHARTFVVVSCHFVFVGSCHSIFVGSCHFVFVGSCHFIFVGSCHFIFVGSCQFIFVGSCHFILPRFAILSCHLSRAPWLRAFASCYCPLSLPSPSQTCRVRSHTGSGGAAVGRVHATGEQSRAFWGCQLC